MVLGGLAFLYCLDNRHQTAPRRARRWGVGLGLYALLFTAVYVSFTAYFFNALIIFVFTDYFFPFIFVLLFRLNFLPLLAY